MTQTTPPNGLHRGWLAFFCLLAGGLSGVALHDLAGLRQFLPPVLVSGRTLACQDLSAYVEHVADLNDHRFHGVIFGIHRPETINAVNQLYDRARCQPRDDGHGHQTYQKLQATVEADVDDPGVPALAVAVQSAPAAPALAPVAPPLALPGAIISNRHHAGTLTHRAYTFEAPAPPAARTSRVVVVDDDPPPAPHCGPDARGIDWHVTGCP